MRNNWQIIADGEISGLHLLLPAFERPLYLLLVPPLCLAAWWIARRSLSGHGLSRRHLHLLVRCLVIALICGTLAQPKVRWRARDVAVVAVMDVSDSVPPDQRTLADEFLSASLAKRPPQDRFGLVTSARASVVQALPAASGGRVEVGAVGPGDASNIEKGLELGQAVVPDDAAGRLLLVSDGNQTSGNLLKIASKLVAAGVPIDVAPIIYNRAGAPRVDQVIVPEWVRDGDTISARIVLSAGQPSAGRLTLNVNGEPVDLDPSAPGTSTRIDLDPGTQVLTQPLRLPSGPVHRVEAVFEPDDKADIPPDVLRAEGVMFTSDRGRILVLAEDSAGAAPLISAISAEHLRIDVRPASAAPSSLLEWSAYEAIVLFDQPASNFSQAQQADLAHAVHEAGAGLVVIGGPSSYGAGGWIGSPVADALPLLLDPPAKRQIPMGALAIIIDRSGSMAAPVAGTGMTQQQIANEAALLAIRSLSREDQITIVSFSGDWKVDVPLTRCTNPRYLERAVHTIGPGGGTNLFPALDAAAMELARSPAGVKHIIVLTDGETVGDPREGLAKTRDLKAHGVTLSTVAIGDFSNSYLLTAMASAGGGRAHVVRTESSRAVLPQILIKEAKTVRRTLIWEGKPFNPVLAIPAESLRGISAPLPAVNGYIVTAERPGLAMTPIRAMENDPLLAQWQYGLGRVTAYTSDAASKWNAPWTAWGSFDAFWRQQLQWTMRPEGDPNAQVSVGVHDERASVTVDLVDSGGEHLNFARVRARLVAPARLDSSLREPPRNVEFRQIGPGRYQADMDVASVGSHLLSLNYEAVGASGERRTGSVRTAIVRRAGEEFRSPAPDTALLYELARRTGGRVYQLDRTGVDLWVRERLKMPEISRAAWLILALAALGLFLVDIAARRVVLDLAWIKSKAQALLSSRSAVAGASLATLAAAKERAASRLDQPRSPMADRPAPEAPEGSRVRAAASPVSVVETPESRSEPPSEADANLTPADVMSRLRAAKKRSGHADDRRDNPSSEA